MVTFLRGAAVKELLSLKGLKENPGGPFIVAFIILVLLAATYLALGNEALANKVAEVGYYFLVAGVLLQLISLLTRKRGG